MTEPSTADQIFLEKLTEIILANLGNEHFGANELAREYGSTRTRLNRKLLALIKKTIHQFVNEVRLRKAMEILRDEDVTVAEVAYRTGFGSPTYFNTSFHDFYGISPGKVKKGEKELRNIPPPDSPRSTQKMLARRTVILTIAGIAFFVVLVLQFIYPGHLFNLRRSTTESIRSPGGRIQLAVFPFQNITNDIRWNVWQTGIQDIMITTLSDSPDKLIIRQTSTINSFFREKDPASLFSITPVFAGKISRRLEATAFIYGSIKQDSSAVRLDAQLTDSGTGEIIKSFQAEGPPGEQNIIAISKSLSQDIRNFLIISGLKKEASIDIQRTAYPTSPESFTCFIYGQNAFFNGDFSTAINWFSQAVAKDSAFTFAILYNALSYGGQLSFEEARKWCMKAYERRDGMPVFQRTYTDYVYSRLFETPHESIKYLKQLLEIDDQLPGIWFKLGERYGQLEQYDKAIAAVEKSLDLYKQMGNKPDRPSEYIMLGTYYHETGEYRKEKKIYRKAQKDFPEDRLLIRRQAVLALTERDTVKANYYLKKYISFCKELSMSEANQVWNVAEIHLFAGLLKEAEMYSRKALLRDPDNAELLSAVAWLLIDNDLNISDGLELTSKAESIRPDPIIYLDCKGWGLFKQGYYEDALKLLEKCYQGCIYPDIRYILSLHIGEVKKAIEARNHALEFKPALKIRAVTQYCQADYYLF